MLCWSSCTLEAILGESGSNDELLEINLGSIWVVLDPTLPIFGPAPAPLGLFLHPLGLHCGHLGANDSHTGAKFGHLGVNLGSLRQIWGQLGADLGPTLMTIGPYRSPSEHVVQTWSLFNLDPLWTHFYLDWAQRTQETALVPLPSSLSSLPTSLIPCATLIVLSSLARRHARSD